MDFVCFPLAFKFWVRRLVSFRWRTVYCTTMIMKENFQNTLSVNVLQTLSNSSDFVRRCPIVLRGLVIVVHCSPDCIFCTSFATSQKEPEKKRTDIRTDRSFAKQKMPVQDRMKEKSREMSYLCQKGFRFWKLKPWRVRITVVLYFIYQKVRFGCPWRM